MMVTASPPMVVTERDRGLAGLEVPAGELELLGDAHDLLDAGQDRELLVEARRQRQPHHPDDRPLLTVDQVRTQTKFLDAVNDEVDDLALNAGFHDDDHGSCFLLRMWRAGRARPLIPRS